DASTLHGTKVGLDAYQPSVYPSKGVFFPMKRLPNFFLLVLLSLCAMRIDAQSTAQPDPLFTTIQSLDTKLFDAYNHCDLTTLGTMVSDDLEFYHDQTGLSVGKEPFGCHQAEHLRKGAAGTAIGHAGGVPAEGIWSGRDRDSSLPPPSER